MPGLSGALGRLRRARARAGREDGFTLVEILATIVLVAVGIFGAISVFDNVADTSASAERYDVGVSYARRVLEDLRAMPYDKLAVSQANLPASSGSWDPQTRVVTSGGTTRYKVPGGPTEDLVAYDAASPYPSYEVKTVGTRRFAVWRFVSWRDEECPILDLSSLNTTLGSLGTLLTSTTGTLNALVGPGGGLTSALSDSNSLLVGGLLGSLGLGSLLSAVTNLVTTGLTPINSSLTSPALLAPLQGSLTALNAVLDPVTGKLKDTIDLCDIPSGAVPDLHELTALTTVLSSLDPLLGAIKPVVDDVGQIVHSLVSLNLFGLLAAVVDAPLIVADTVILAAKSVSLQSLLGSVTDTAGNLVTLPTLVSRVTTSLQSLLTFLAAPNTTHNTKRVTVAVQLLNPTGTGVHGPRRPLWMSTVVTNPLDGLL